MYVIQFTPIQSEQPCAVIWPHTPPTLLSRARAKTKAEEKKFFLASAAVGTFCPRSSLRLYWVFTWNFFPSSLFAGSPRVRPKLSNINVSGPSDGDEKFLRLFFIDSADFQLRTIGNWIKESSINYIRPKQSSVNEQIALSPFDCQQVFQSTLLTLGWMLGSESDWKLHHRGRQAVHLRLITNHQEQAGSDPPLALIRCWFRVGRFDVVGSTQDGLRRWRSTSVESM